MGVSKNKNNWLLAGISAFALCAGSAHAQAVYSFGDSLSDTGNVNDLSLGLVAGSDYFDGRFSNGFLWTDYLSALSAGIEQERNPGLAGPFLTITADGYNFAHGGAVSGTLGPNVDVSLFGNPLGAISALGAFRVTAQADHFRDNNIFGARTFVVGPRDFATISAGGNDYFNGETDVTRVVGNTFAAIESIRQGGIKNVLLLDVPNVGDVPRRFGTPDQAPLNALSDDHNVLVRDVAAAYEASNPGSFIAVINASGLFSLAIQDAQNNGGALFGFTNVAPGPGTSGNCLGDGLVLGACPDNYLFYDDIHPTARAHAIIAELTVATVRAKLAGEQEPIARFLASNQLVASGNQVVSSRLQALAEGATGSGVLGPAFGFSGDGRRTFGSLGFSTSGTTPLGQQRLSFFRHSVGQETDVGYYNLAHFDTAPVTMDVGPGEFTNTIGADYLWSDNFAIGAMMTNASFDRQYIDTNMQDESVMVALYGAWFDGPTTYTLTARSGQSRQNLVRSTGFRYTPSVSARTESSLSSVVLGVRRETPAFGQEIATVAKVSHTRAARDGYEEEGSFGLLDHSIPDAVDAAVTAVVGLEAEKEFSFGRAETRLSLEGGLLWSSDERLGLYSLVEETGLALNDANEIGSIEDYGFNNESQFGGYVGVQADLFSRRGFGLSARGDVVATETAAPTVFKLNARWDFK